MSTFRYISDFGSRDGHTWRAVIDRREADGSDAVVIAVQDFDFDLQAAVISWKQTEKWEPLQGSSCTLRVVSPTDRAFIDLYAAEPGDVVLHFYRDSSLYWTGTLDPEFYEEPYTSACNYEVELTFSDLGALDRLTYDCTEVANPDFDHLVRSALGAAQLPEDYTLRTALHEPGADAAIELKQLSVATANFIDEEGEPLSWHEVLEGILQPLGLRIVQQQGHFIVYDLHTAMALSPATIEWDGTDATLGVDKVYNNIEVEFSPYGDSAAAECKIDHDDLEDSSKPWSIYWGGSGNDKFESFRVQQNGHKGYPIIENHSRACTYKMTSIYSGEDGAGIAAKMPQPDGSDWFGAVYVNNIDALGMGLGPNEIENTTGPLFKAIERTFAPSLSSGAAMLKICMQMMLDTRTNPFDDAQDSSHNKGLHSVYVPVRIWFELPDGTNLRYSNKDTADSAFGSDGNRWEEGAPRWGDAYLCYYNWTEISKNTPCNGWMTNKPCIGRKTKNAPEMWQKRGEGDFITLPGQVLMQGGTLHVEVGSDVEFGHSTEIKGWFVDNGRITFDAKWLLYKSVTVDVVDRYGKAIDSEDVVRSTSLNPHAKDPLTIDTICGTAIETTPTARGIIKLKTSDRAATTALQQLSRGDITDNLENLLIAAVASQYDSRHTTLSGTVAAEAFGGMFGLYTDRAQPSGRVFTPDQADYDVQAGEISTRFVELSPQKYLPQESNNPLWPTLKH